MPGTRQPQTLLKAAILFLLVDPVVAKQVRWHRQRRPWSVGRVRRRESPAALAAGVSGRFDTGEGRFPGDTRQTRTIEQVSVGSAGSVHAGTQSTPGKQTCLSLRRPASCSSGGASPALRQRRPQENLSVECG
jgi:hypothetical protein